MVSWTSNLRLYLGSTWTDRFLTNFPQVYYKVDESVEETNGINVISVSETLEVDASKQKNAEESAILVGDIICGCLYGP